MSFDARRLQFFQFSISRNGFCSEFLKICGWIFTTFNGRYEIRSTFFYPNICDEININPVYTRPPRNEMKGKGVFICAALQLLPQHIHAAIQQMKYLGTSVPDPWHFGTDPPLTYGSGSGSYSFLQWKIVLNWILNKKYFNKWNLKSSNFKTLVED